MDEMDAGVGILCGSINLMNYKRRKEEEKNKTTLNITVELNFKLNYRKMAPKFRKFNPLGREKWKRNEHTHLYMSVLVRLSCQLSLKLVSVSSRWLFVTNFSLP